MIRISKFAKQVLNRLQDHFQKSKSQFEKKDDDTVEAQAQTFRIWMWSTAAGLTLILISTVVSMSRGAEKADLAAGGEASLLTSLPDGYVLAPIEPANLDSLDSIFEDHGYADLYRSSDSNERGAKIARGLALIRAPKNPRRFAILVPESDSDLLAELNQPVIVVLRKKPKSTANERQPKSRRKSESPLIRETKGDIQLIEEEIPEVTQSRDAGATS